MSRNTQNKLILFLMISLTLSIWLGSKWWYGDTFPDIYKYFAKGASLSATVCMGFSVVLSSRLKFFENIFGGLDKIYHLHKFSGKLAFYLILLHPLFLSIRKLPDIAGFFGFWGFQNMDNWYNIGHNIGYITIIAMITLISLSLWIKIPYQLWKKTHEYFGVVYILTALHVLAVNADIPKYPLLSIWMYSWLILGIAAFIYIRFFYYILGPRFEYVVDNIDIQKDIIEICLNPINPNKVLRHRPSQFAYVKFINPKISPELHPYSIASAPEESGSIKFGIKRLGDHTQSLINLKEGDKAMIFGPYGRFSESFLTAESDCLFIGGGIGITPFLGMWDMALNSDEAVGYDERKKLINFSPSKIMKWKSPRVDLFYVVNEEDEASFDNDIKKAAIRSKFNGFKDYTKRGHSYQLYLSDVNGRISANYIASAIPDYKNREIFICGPHTMMDALIQQFADLGVDRERIHTENFNLVNQQFHLTPWQLKKLQK